MKRKTAVLLATIGLLATISTSLALQWYFSAPQYTPSTEYKVSMDKIPETMTKDAITQISGNVTLAGVPQEGIKVWIWVNGNQTNFYGFTDVNGIWSIGFYQNYTDGTVLKIEAGVHK